MPIARTQSAGRSIGGWGAGYFKGVIDEVRLYNRGLDRTRNRRPCANDHAVGRPGRRGSR